MPSTPDDLLWTHAARHVAFIASPGAREDRRWRFYSKFAGGQLSGIPMRQWELECSLADAWFKRQVLLLLGKGP